MSTLSEWELFQTFGDLGSAEVLCAWLLREEVLAMVERRYLEDTLELEFHVLVHRSLMHRARWVVSQQPVSDAELEFLATSKLPGQEEPP